MIPEDIPIKLLSRIAQIDIFDIDTLIEYSEYIGEDRVVKILQEVQEYILLQPLSDNTTDDTNI
jgi:L-arabinose isomerase